MTRKPHQISPSQRDLLSLPGATKDRLRALRDAQLLPEPKRDSSKPGRPHTYPPGTLELVEVLLGPGSLSRRALRAWVAGWPVNTAGARRIVIGILEQREVIADHRLDKAGGDPLVVGEDDAHRLRHPSSTGRAARGPRVRALKRALPRDELLANALPALRMIAHGQQPTWQPPEPLPDERDTETLLGELLGIDRASELLDAQLPTLPELMGLLARSGVTLAAGLPGAVETLDNEDLLAARSVVAAMAPGVLEDVWGSEAAEEILDDPATLATMIAIAGVILARWRIERAEQVEKVGLEEQLRERA